MSGLVICELNKLWYVYIYVYVCPYDVYRHTSICYMHINYADADVFLALAHMTMTCSGFFGDLSFGVSPGGRETSWALLLLQAPILFIMFLYL